jgi:prolyl-tRNA synthetase
MASFNKAKLTSRSQDYAAWYLDVAKNGDLFEYSPTPGCITFLPKSVAIWERVKSHIDGKLKRLGVQNILLPTLIPMSFFEKEKNLVEGFSPELAVVTHGGGKELEEKLAFRPTSEVMFCDFFRGRLQSYRDLPILSNQWCNVLRWEKRTRPFLRTAEFHWQEGHTIHETTDEATIFAEKILHEVYIPTIRDVMAIAGVSGRKSESEKFPGADVTMTYEPMMSNGWALQMCTSHILGRGFMESFDVKFSGRDGVDTFPAYTSWGLSTRTIGGMISCHSDDNGLVIPPLLSEYQSVLLPLFGRDSQLVKNYTGKVLEALGHTADERVPVSGASFVAVIESDLATLIDEREARLGEKIKDWELSGYPIRIEYGERDVAGNTVVIASRITSEKLTVPLPELKLVLHRMLADGQKDLLRRSEERLRENTVACSSLDDIVKAIEAEKFVLYNWDLNPQFEIDIKESCKATVRCLPFEGQWVDDVMDRESGKQLTLIARNF